MLVIAVDRFNQRVCTTALADKELTPTLADHLTSWPSDEMLINAIGRRNPYVFG